MKAAILAEQLTSQLARQVHGDQVSYDSRGGQVTIEVRGWTIRVSNLDAPATTVTDPDGDAVKLLFEQPSHAISFVARQLGNA